MGAARECPACGAGKARTLFRGTDRLYRTTSEVFSVVECEECGLVRLSPWPTPSQMRRYYPDHYWFAPQAGPADSLEETYRRLVLRGHLDFVESALERSGEQGAVVDVGCGGGLFLAMLQARGRRVVGLDLSCDAAAIAWRSKGVPAVCARLSRAPLPPGSCAAVTMFHVLEHLYDPASYLDAAGVLLRPEGRLVVQVPNASCWQFLLFGENWSGIDVPRHLIDFRARDLELLLADTGFEIVRTKHFSLRDNPAGFATSLAPWLDPMARRVRGLRETQAVRLGKDLIYFALVAAALPFTLVESACRAGATVMVEARKKR